MKVKHLLTIADWPHRLIRHLPDPPRHCPLFKLRLAGSVNASPIGNVEL